ncbi:MAG: FprA family A-type flavoprotein [Bacteroidales bacterium]|nr:FprA family A-type flavoprotein [Bacteroidales bacterium]
MNNIADNIRYVGVNDHGKVLFEGLWPLPYGVSYNSYLVVDDKIALIDTVEADFAEEFLGNIKAEIGDRKIDYLIVNHMEPDHSSLMARIREEYPDITVVASQKALPMIAGYHGMTENVKAVADGEELSLGSSTLSFYLTPMVHWPETMMTYAAGSKTLFSGDAFGTFGAVDGNISDAAGAMLHGYSGEHKGCAAEFREEMIRYYSNIVGKYGVPVQNALKKLGALEIGRICSTHGPVWENGRAEVISLYDMLSRYEGERGVCIVYGSMYGNTAKAAKAIEASLIEKGIPYAIHDLCQENLSYAYRDAFKFNTMIVGSPTYNAEVFPPVETFMRGIASRGLKKRRFAAFGSYTWAGASVRLLNEAASKLGFELLSDGMSFAQAFNGSRDNDAMESIVGNI